MPHVIGLSAKISTNYFSHSFIFFPRIAKGIGSLGKKSSPKPPFFSSATCKEFFFGWAKQPLSPPYRDSDPPLPKILGHQIFLPKPLKNRVFCIQ
jgi:hypothetical protein